MNVDNQLRLTEFFLQPPVLTSQLFILVGQQVFGLRLATSPLGRQAGQDALVALPPPVGQMRRVEALASQQLTELAHLGTGGRNQSEW